MDNLITFLIAYYGMTVRHAEDYRAALSLLEEVPRGKDDPERDLLLDAIAVAIGKQVGVADGLIDSVGPSLTELTGIEFTPETVADLIRDACAEEE